jgi:hypothetical protein
LVWVDIERKEEEDIQGEGEGPGNLRTKRLMAMVHFGQKFENMTMVEEERTLQIDGGLLDLAIIVQVAIERDH